MSMVLLRINGSLTDRHSPGQEEGGSNADSRSKGNNVGHNEITLQQDHCDHERNHDLQTSQRMSKNYYLHQLL